MGIIKFNNVPSTTPGLEVETFPNYVSPEKEYQVTHVPGRNGDLVVDTKTYKNVPRPYKVSMAVEPPAVSVSGSTASFEATAERALAECKTAISSDVGKVGTTIINSATDPVENNEPYNFRAVPNGVGDRENDTLIGGTVAWNQLAQFTQAQIPSNNNGITYAYTDGTSVKCNGTATADETRSGWFGLAETNGFKDNVGHKVIINTAKISGTASSDVYFGWGTTPNKIGTSIISAVPSGTQRRFYYRIPNGTTCTDYIFTVNCIDLTQMFGSTIADYIYGLETATAGAGVAWFRNLFPKDYYAYNAGELISVKTEAHKTTGKNFLKNNLSSQTYNGVVFTVNSDGTITLSGTATAEIYRTFHIYLPKGSYIYSSGVTESFSTYDTYIAKDGTTIARGNSILPGPNFMLTEYSDLVYAVRVRSGVTANITIKPLIRLSSVVDATYEPYEEHIYPLNPALELRGIPKLNSSNKLYYDGDIYSSDGSVVRKYGIVDLGTLSWSKDTTTRPADGATIHAWYATLSAARNSSDIGFVGNLLVSGYKRTKTYIVDYGGRDTVDDKLVGGADTNHRIWLYNSAYSDYTGAQIKTALSGVYLIYELATPVIESTSGLIDNVSIASFDDVADNEPINSLVVDITAIESGSGEKSPDNPYTISGFDNGIITRCGKNLFNPMTQFNATGNYMVAKNVLPNTKCVISFIDKDTSVDISGIYFGFIDSSYTSGTPATDKYVWAIINGTVLSNRTNVTSLMTLTGLFALPNNQTTIDKLLQRFDIQIELGDTATTYEAYNGTTYTFTFGQTVYGGHLNVTTGELTITHGIVDLGTLNWNYYQTAGKNTFNTNDVNFVPNNTSICSVYEYYPAQYISVQPDKTFAFYDRPKLSICDNDFTDANDFKTAMNGVMFVYELATPITLAITSQDIPTLLGENNIFSNCGNIKTLSYPKQVCPFEPAQEVDDHGTEEYVDNREVAIPVGHESKYFTAGKIYNFSWLDEAGLIKEGELNADTGVLTITNGYKVIDIGDISWVYNDSRVFFSTAISDIKTVSSGTIGNMSCSIYTVSTAISSTTDIANKPDMTIFQQKNNASVFIKNSSFTDATTFKSAMHGIKLLYELADPVRTIQLTPVQVESLIGNNVLISESGNISVTPRTYSTYTEKMNAISDWLHSASGYARLEDTYEPDYYRKAYYDEQTDMENIFNEAGQATLNFICKPQRYLKSGEEPITISSGGLIQNRTRYEAYPILKVTTNNTQGSVSIGNHSITIKAGAGTDPITIDCELQDAWSGTSNKNSYIVLTDSEFPVIDPGTQTVTFDGGVQSVEVIPRWWTV